MVEVPSAPLSVPVLRRYTHTPWPRRILWREWAEARHHLGRFAAEPYDLVWYSHADSYTGLGDPTFRPAIVDLDNLEDRLLRQVPRPSLLRPVSARFPTMASRLDLRSLAKWSLDRVDLRLWGRLQQGIVDRAYATVVCSDLDHDRLRGRRVAVIPNGYVDPGPPAAALPPEPTLLMIARYTYQPNLDAVAWFSRRVLPRLRELVPDVSVRLVGRHDERLLEVVSGSAITVVGEVDDVGSELRSARAVIVPLRSGSGTRIKVIESLAYGVPVVTTSVGCEGLGIESGVHALVADNPITFAESCRTVLTDDQVCARLQAAGREIFLDQYDWKEIEPRITGLATEAVAHDGRRRSAS